MASADRDEKRTGPDPSNNRTRESVIDSMFSQPLIELSGQIFRFITLTLPVLLLYIL